MMSTSILDTSSTSNSIDRPTSTPKTFMAVYSENVDCNTRIEVFSNEEDLAKSLKEFIIENILEIYTNHDDRETYEELDVMDEWSAEKTIRFALAHGRDPLNLYQYLHRESFWTLQAIIEGQNMSTKLSEVYYERG